MEDALVPRTKKFGSKKRKTVLILVVMEDALVQVTQGINGYPRGVS